MNPITSYFSSGKTVDDLLSPILVKELRQGMRARVFVISFLLLQVFLVVLVLGNVAAQDDRNTLDVQDHFFWVIVGFALLVLMPLRGLVTVSGEIKNHTMETIMLTRLTAWRVVFGKWSALFAQSLLFVSAVLPYIVLRYFIGGDDVVSDFEWILLMLWLSAILISASIAVSSMGNMVVRIIILIGLIVAISTGAGDFSTTGFGSFEPGEIIGALIIYGFFIPALLFELTASGIAPHSENHAIRRRLLALAFFGAAWGLGSTVKGNFQVGIMIPLIILVGVCCYELSEKPRLLPRMVQTQYRRLGPGRIAGIFLLPGWPSALLFSLIVIPAAMVVCYQFVPPDTKAGWLFPIFAVLGSVITPVFICHLFWPRMKQVLLMIVLYNVVLSAITSILEGFSTLTHFHIDPFLSLVPSLPVLVVVLNANPDWVWNYGVWYLMGNSIVLGAMILALLVASRSYFRELITLSRIAKNPSSTTPPADSAPATP